MTIEEEWRRDALSWIGRKVRITDEPSTEGGLYEVGVVVCVDATDYRPSAWVKVGEAGESGMAIYPNYRSCDLCWLEDLDSADVGPVWGSPPSLPNHGELDALVVSERISCIHSLETSHDD